MAVNPMLSSGIVNQPANVNVSHAATPLNPKESRAVDSAERIDVRNMDELGDAIVDLKLYQRQVEANAKVVETADAVIGFLLDIHA